jgi:hypothetical protein
MMQTNLMRRLAYFALMLATVLPLSAQFLGAKRLILKDGSYQPVITYEIKGDRVRYQSAERFTWEDIPVSLIDWAATEKYMKEGPQLTEEQQKEKAEMDAEERAEREAELARSPEVAPGVRLPEEGGVFMLDIYRGQPMAAEIVQSGGEINKQTGKNVLRAVINPIAKAKQSIELKGLNARVQSHVPQPTFYVAIEQDTGTALAPSDRFRIARATQDKKRGTRIVGSLKVSMIGSVSQEGTFIPATVEKFTGPWLKVTPSQPLERGEYAIVEMLGAKEMNLYVWDFGVNPSAPENQSAWKPEPPQQNKAGTDEKPILNQRKP